MPEVLAPWLVYAALYLGTGAFAGVLAGLLGVGGGLVIVPMLHFVFQAQGLPAASLQHLALGTSLASIIFTSISSLRAHHSRGAVLWGVVRAITPGILIGTFLGSKAAALLSSRFLTGFFVCFLYYVAAQMLLNIKPKPSRQIPGCAGMFGAGAGIGGVSALVGIGGGTMTVPFLAWCNVPLHSCIGTSAAVGLPIAVAGTAGYILNGLSAPLPGLDQGFAGFVYLPALAGVVAASVLTAPLGAKIAHSLPVHTLKKVFACLLLGMATKMLWGML